MSLSILFTEQEIKAFKAPNNDNKTVYAQFGRDESEYYYITSIDEHNHIYGFNSNEQSFGYVHEMELLTRLSFKHPNLKPFPLSSITNEINFNNFLGNAIETYKEYTNKEQKVQPKIMNNQINSIQEVKNTQSLLMKEQQEEEFQRLHDLHLQNDDEQEIDR